MTDQSLMPDKIAIWTEESGRLQILANPDETMGPEDTVYVRADLAAAVSTDALTDHEAWIVGSAAIEAWGAASKYISWNMIAGHAAYTALQSMRDRK